MRRLVGPHTTSPDHSDAHTFRPSSFTQTNQTQFLNSDDLSGVLQGIHNICGLESSLLGGVATADGEVTPTTSLDVPKATDTTSGAASLTSRADVAIAIAVISSAFAAIML